MVLVTKQVQMAGGASIVDVESVPKEPIVLPTLHTVAQVVQMDKLHPKKEAQVPHSVLQVGNSVY